MKDELLKSLAIIAGTQIIYWTGVALGKRWGYAQGKRDAYVEINKKLEDAKNEFLVELAKEKRREELKSLEERLLN